MVSGVLIVDDSGYMRNRIKAILGDRVEVVDEAENGVEAVEQYKRYQDAVDVVLMDVIMDQANGVKATSAIKEIDPGATILMCTSVGQYKKMKLAARAGADGYVTKPFEEEELVEALETVGA